VSLELLALVYGALVGVSLGLTGGGGSLFALPLLVYGLGTGLSTAAALSLVAVGLSAAFGAALQRRAVHWRAGLIFAAGGMALAPSGAWLSSLLPQSALLAAFAVLLLGAAWRMGRRQSGAAPAPGPCSIAGPGVLSRGCVLRLLGGGALAGILSGLFGVGGGFIIVPVLIFTTAMPIHRAIATSLLVISLISASGVAAHLWRGTALPLPLTLLFNGGALAGMFTGSMVRGRFSPQRLRKVFAAAMGLLGVWMLVRTLIT
jgi:uncharacterized membrane protein YfcA